MIGVLLFALVAGAAVFLNYCTVLIEGTGVSRYLVEAVRLLEFFLFACDFICFIVFQGKETWILLREIVRPTVGVAYDERLLGKDPRLNQG